VQLLKFYINARVKFSIKNSFDQSSNGYTLYLIAQVPPHIPAILFHQSSPRVILESYVGPNNTLHAPEWTRWAKPTLEFQQPKRTFAALFLRFAALKENTDVVRLTISDSVPCS
jgi:hypothetical protein